MKKVILVNQNDEEIGFEEKIKAHKQGKLHRAFSIFIFNGQKQLLLQRRNKAKYHCAGLWSNTCCSHPKPGEVLEDAVHRRLKEEMGFDCELKEIFNFTYRAKLDNGLIENEFDHVFIGNFEGSFKPNPEEVDDWKWISINELKEDINKNSRKYTSWLRVILKEHSRYFPLKTFNPQHSF